MNGSNVHRRHVAFVATYDPLDPTAWSGIPARMAAGLQSAGLDLSPIGPLHRRGDTFWRIHRRASLMLGRAPVLPDREPWVAEGYASQVTRAFSVDPPRAALSPGTVALSRVRTEAPRVVWADATFSVMRDYYDNFSRLAPRSVVNGEALEAEALQACAATIFSSGWAARSAVEHYGVPPDRVHEIPLGANLDPQFSPAEIEQVVLRRPWDKCELLFVGLDWERKGAALAVEVASLLNRRGLPTRLTVVGCEPPPSASVPDCVQVAGYVSGAGDARHGPLGRLFANAHFFILPTRAEAFGIVFAEASAFGVPSLATRTGGVESAVSDGVNGWLFDPDAGPRQYCLVLERLMADRETYLEAALSAYREYVHRLNWRCSCRDAAEVIRSVWLD